MFKDVKPGIWYFPPIARMLKKKAISGYEDGTFKPKANITRAEVVAMIEKALNRRFNLIREVVPSVVRIEAAQSNGRTSIGSGVVLDMAGYIATNVHVILDSIDPSEDIKIYFDCMPENPITAKIKYGDFKQDIAILKVDSIPERVLKPVELGQRAELLEYVFCVGNPLAEYTNTVTMGIVSYPSRKQSDGSEWIQTDASINPGNSGGGAFNEYGELVGLPTRKVVYSSIENKTPVENIGFITPVWKIKQAYEEAKRGNIAFVGELKEEIILDC